MPRSYSPPASPDRPTTAQSVDTAGCVDPARVSPLHLPALGHVAADLDGLGAPVRIVNAAYLDWCEDCAAGDDVPVWGAIATVVAYDEHGFGYRTEGCALHLPGVVRHFQGHGWPTTVEVPASGGRRWFERSDRETYWALDDTNGIAVVRALHDCWQVIEVCAGLPVALLALVPDRAVAELLAQAVAAVRAADAYEAGLAATGVAA